MTMAEVRRDERVRSLLRARIIFNGGNSTIDCTIKNLSASGAKIELSDVVSIPAEFDLEVPQKNRIYRVRLMWRDAEAMGVHFVEGANDTAVLEMRIDRLEQENKRLKSKLALMTKRLDSLGQDINGVD